MLTQDNLAPYIHAVDNKFNHPPKGSAEMKIFHIGSWCFCWT